MELTIDRTNEGEQFLIILSNAINGENMNETEKITLGQLIIIIDKEKSPKAAFNNILIWFNNNFSNKKPFTEKELFDWWIKNYIYDKVNFIAFPDTKNRLLSLNYYIEKSI